MQANTPEDSTVDRLQQTTIGLGILGFDPATDAIRQPLHDGVRIWYCRSEKLRWVARTRHGQRRWESPATSSPSDLQKALTAAGDFDLVDKRPFNWLTTGPLDDVSGAHDGIAWGITLLYGSGIERDGSSPPNAHQLQAVAGIGDRLGREIASQLRNHGKPADERR